MEWDLNIAPHRGGRVDAKMLARGEAAPGVGFDFGLYRYHPGEGAFVTPRHRHENDQIRFSLEGDHNFVPNKNLPEGWVGYFSPGTAYGPQRTDRGLNLRAQFGVSSARLKSGSDDTYQELLRSGTFQDGVYTHIDPATGRKMNREAADVLYEKREGRTLVYPVARYEEPILINPSAFEWRRFDQGVWQKHLGTFTEREERIAMFRFEEGGVLALSPERLQLLFTLSGEVIVDGAARRARTGICSPMGESLDVVGHDGAELLFIGGPLA
jgi:hypothetical protein